MMQPKPSPSPIYALIDYPDLYVQPLLLRALRRHLSLNIEFIDTVKKTPHANDPTLQITGYENIDFEHALQNPRSSLVCSYIIRKALIRKHYLSNTVATWLVKHLQSLLASHFKPCIHFELDFAEFLDEALVDAWDLNESMARNAEAEDELSKEWWILKPGMSDGGNGIRLFSSMTELQEIFEEWEQSIDDDDDEGVADSEANETPGQLREATAPGTMTSQLRHFIAQPYIPNPLLLSSYDNRKFHIRVYVLSVGALKVYVYREMLALFAARPYKAPSRGEGALELAGHLTNTCFQDDGTKGNSVHQFWELKDEKMVSDWKDRVFDQICLATGEVFEAAAREQMVHFQVIPNAFEIFGVDFLVDDQCNVWLLELNTYPDFRQTGDELQEVVVGGLFEEVVSVAVVPFFGASKTNAHLGSERMRLVKDVDLGRR